MLTTILFIGVMFVLMGIMVVAAYYKIREGWIESEKEKLWKSRNWKELQSIAPLSEIMRKFWVWDFDQFTKV